MKQVAVRQRAASGERRPATSEQWKTSNGKRALGGQGEASVKRAEGSVGEPQVLLDVDASGGLQRGRAWRRAAESWKRESEGEKYAGGRRRWRVARCV